MNPLDIARDFIARNFTRPNSAMSAPATQPAPSRTKHKALYSVFIVAIVCAIFIRAFIVEGFIVKGDSMSPNILDGDYVFINRLAYIFGEPERGDIVVAVPRNDSRKIIKRIIGLPGDWFKIEDGHVLIKSSMTDAGTLLEEAYLVSSTTDGTTYRNMDPKEYFAMGDNREVSMDSRELGPIDKWQIKGKVFGIFRISTREYIGL